MGLVEHRAHEQPRVREVALWSVGSIIVFPLFAIAYLVFKVTGPVWAAQVTFALAPILAAVALALTWRHVKSRDERLFWGLLTGAVASLACAESFYGLHVVLVGRGPGSPSLFDLASISGLGFLVLLFVRVGRLHRLDASNGARVVADAVCVLALAYSGLWAVWGAVAVDATDPVRPMWITVGYSLVGVLLLLGVFRVASVREERRARWETFVLAGVGVFGLGVMFFPYFEANISFVVSMPVSLTVETLYMLGYQLVLTGSILRLRERSRIWVPPQSRTHRRFDQKWAVTAAIGVLLAVVVLGLAATLTPHDAPSHVVFLASASIASIGLVVRTAASGIEVDALASKVSTDPVSGARDYRDFQFQVAGASRRASDSGHPLSLIFVDIDDFGLINARIGYGEADRLLAKTAHVMNRLARHDVHRVGGDEFAVLVPDSSKDSALALALRIKSALGRIVVDDEGLRVSMGVAAIPEDSHSSRELVRHARAACTWAKLNGKNRALVYDVSMIRSLEPSEHARLAESRVRLDGARSLIAAAEARDPEAADRAHTVSALAASLSRTLGFAEEMVQRIEVAASLHDAGRILLPESDAPSGFVPNDGPSVRQTEFTAVLLEAMELYDLAEWIRSHLERWDGTGAPRGLAGEEIPLESRIIAACHSFDRRARARDMQGASVADVLGELADQSGAALDPQMVSALFGLLSCAQERSSISELGAAR